MKKIILITLTAVMTITFFSCKSKPAAEEEVLEAPIIEPEKTPEPEIQVKEVATSESGIENTKVAIEPKVVDNSEILSKVDEARNAALKVGAEDLAKEQLAQIDKVYESLKEKSVDVTAEGNDLVVRYNTLSNYIKAKSLKEKLDTNNYASYAQQNYDKGLENLAIVEAAYASEETMTTAIADAANQAYSNFNTVYITAYKQLARQERKAALESKKQADGVKAGVSRKEQYNEATQKLQDGDSLYSMQSPEKALENYKVANQIYSEIAKDVAEKRAAAEKAIEAAKKRVAESAKFAEMADANTPIKESIDGIEEDDTVLLEQDEYENPDDSVIEITSVLEDDEEDAEIAVEESTEESENTEEESTEESEEMSDEESESAAESDEKTDETEESAVEETEAIDDIPADAIITGTEDESIEEVLIEEELSENDSAKTEEQEE